MKRPINFRTLVFMAGLMIFAFPLLAQEGQGRQVPPPGGGPGGGMRGMMSEEAVKERVDRTAETLELTGDQKKQILKIELDFFNSMQNMRPNTGGRPSESDFQAMRENMEKIRTERDEKYAAVLTEAQMEKYQKLMEERMQRMQEMRGGPPGGGQRQGDTTRVQRGRGRGN